MQPVLNVEDIRAVEARLAREGVSVAELMYRAGNAVAQEVLGLEDTHSVTILAGVGNNGGDGWVAAEALRREGVVVAVVTPCPISELKSDLVRVIAGKAEEAGAHVFVGPSRLEIEQLVASSDVVVDAILGTGFHGKLSNPFDIWVDVLNQSGVPVVAVDVPSGLSAQTGLAAGNFVRADVTVTMLALKPGLLADQGRDACGAIVVAPLANQTEQLVIDADPVAWRNEVTDYVEVLDEPTAAVDKYSRGSVLVVGGSYLFPGAAIMAAKAAARAGAGYVTLAVPDVVAATAQAHLLDIPVVGLPSEKDGTFAESASKTIRQLAERRDATLVGPGMLVTSSTVAVVSSLLDAACPLVLDADGINCLARLTSDNIEDYPEVVRREYPLILTPHRRELGRLVGLKDNPPESLTSALNIARRVVWSNGGRECVVVAKGTATACVSVDVALLPKPGPAALATAGSGDVLAGIMAARLSHGVDDIQNLPLLAAQACEIHGLAGSMAQERYGTTGVVASDLIDLIGLAADDLSDRALYADFPEAAQDEE
jgi:NAD(P)H-hydrate epimerase